MHLPLTPGRHRVTVRTFRPLASSLLGRLQSWLNGMRPEFIESLSSLQRARGERRPATASVRPGPLASPPPYPIDQVARVQSFGSVSLVLDVAIQGMEQLGYAVTPPPSWASLQAPASPFLPADARPSS